MQGTPHLLAGAALGTALRRPWLVMPVAFMSHFLLDFTPHLDAHALFGAPHGGPTRGEIVAACLDGIVGLILLTWLSRRHPAPKSLWLGAFCALLIDLVDNIPPWNRAFRTWAITAPIHAFHHGIQSNVVPAQWPLGLSTQLLVSGVAIWYVRRQRPSGEVLHGSGD
jgi:hypothetical protein